MWYIIAVLAAIFSYLLYKFFNEHKLNLEGKHVLITGGSKGIGRSLAMQVVAQGGHVTIVAREKSSLEQAKLDILRKSVMSGKQKVSTFSCDVSGDINDVEKMIDEAETISGPIHVLICCAGSAVSLRFDETPAEDFRRMMNVNYFSAVNVARIVVPLMKTRNEGHIVFVSSVAGLVGLYGFSAYSAAKFALVGLAESLVQELKPFNIKITVALPPDTDTPGYAEEQKTKPVETKMISEAGGLFSADTVAKRILCDSMEGNFTSTVGFESWMVRTACSGMMPFNSMSELITQVFTMGIFRIAAAVFLHNSDKTIKKCADEREMSKKSS